MREQIVVLPPSAERSKSSFSLNKKEEALLSVSRNWAVSDGENVEQLRSVELIERHYREITHSELASAEHMKPHDAHKAFAEPISQACEDVGQTNDCAEASFSPERMRNSPSFCEADALLLQWGPGKRPRCSRGRPHNPHGQVGNHSTQPNEPSVLYRKTVRVQADMATAVRLNASFYASKGTIKSVPADEKDLWLDEKQKQKAKDLKGGPSDVKQSTTGSGKRGCSSLHKPDELHQKSKTCTLGNPTLLHKDQCVIPLPASPSKNELVWPKFVIALSRKEKEEDFLILKGTKLPHRPRRRPKVVERALHFCTPGSWLADITPSQYDVREKKRARKRATGLKAMESCDSDAD